jgi:hypothetical protein
VVKATETSDSNPGWGGKPSMAWKDAVLVPAVALSAIYSSEVLRTSE